MECDVIIYDITQDPEQVDEACWAISALHNELEKIDKPKTFVLISTVMTWAKTKPVDPVKFKFFSSDFQITFLNRSIKNRIRKSQIFHLPRKISDEESLILITRSIWQPKRP
jgi:adenylate kinase